MDKNKSQCKLLKPLLSHEHHWQLLENYLSGEKERLVTLILSCDAASLYKLQGELAGITKLLNMHEQLKAEERSR